MNLSFNPFQLFQRSEQLARRFNLDLKQSGLVSRDSLNRPSETELEDLHLNLDRFEKQVSEHSPSEVREEFKTIMAGLWKTLDYLYIFEAFKKEYNEETQSFEIDKEKLEKIKNLVFDLFPEKFLKEFALANADQLLVKYLVADSRFDASRIKIKTLRNQDNYLIDGLCANPRFMSEKLITQFIGKNRTVLSDIIPEDSLLDTPLARAIYRNLKLEDHNVWYFARRALRANPNTKAVEGFFENKYWQSDRADIQAYAFGIGDFDHPLDLNSQLAFCIGKHLRRFYTPQEQKAIANNPNSQLVEGLRLNRRQFIQEQTNKIFAKCVSREYNFTHESNTKIIESLPDDIFINNLDFEEIAKRKKSPDNYSYQAVVARLNSENFPIDSLLGNKKLAKLIIQYYPDTSAAQKLNSSPEFVGLKTLAVLSDPNNPECFAIVRGKKLRVKDLDTALANKGSPFEEAVLRQLDERDFQIKSTEQAYLEKIINLNPDSKTAEKIPSLLSTEINSNWIDKLILKFPNSNFTRACLDHRNYRIAGNTLVNKIREPAYWDTVLAEEIMATSVTEPQYEDYLIAGLKPGSKFAIGLERNSEHGTYDTELAQAAEKQIKAWCHPNNDSSYEITKAPDYRYRPDLDHLIAWLFPKSPFACGLAESEQVKFTQIDIDFAENLLRIMNNLTSKKSGTKAVRDFHGLINEIYNPAKMPAAFELKNVFDLDEELKDSNQLEALLESSLDSPFLMKLISLHSSRGKSQGLRVRNYWRNLKKEYPESLFARQQ